ncbi:MAG: Fic family protein [Verrucomicrobiota bacterium]
MNPPFTISSKTLGLVSRIERMIGRLESFDHPAPQPQLRKSNRVRTLHGSLGIEGNTLSQDQITAILENKPVIAPKNEILEILNANAAYEILGDLDPLNKDQLLEAHGIMMRDLIQDAGRWRSGDVGILKQGKVSHLAPPANRVPYLMTDLFDFLKGEDHPLIQGAVFHYEFEFIHPFSDGNGRVGRFWHSLMLYNFHPVFEYIPLESVVKTYQQDYYQVLETCDNLGESTRFIEFSLQMIEQALDEFLELFRPTKITPNDRISSAQRHFKSHWFTRKAYMSLHREISSATASRDLKSGIARKLLESQGEKATTKYRFL